MSIQQLIDAGFKPSGITANEYDIEINDGVSLCVWLEDSKIAQVYIDNFDAGIECQLPVMTVEKVIELSNVLRGKS